MKNTNFADFFKSVKQIRKDRGLTLKDVSNKTGIPLYLLNKFENDKMMMNTVNLILLAKLYRKKLVFKMRDTF